MAASETTRRPALARAREPDDRITALAAERRAAPALERTPDGTVVIGSHALAQRILRSRETEQAGFNADLVRRLPQRNVSILFREGEAHRRQRNAVARFFTPAAVATRYRAVMETTSDRLVAELRRSGRGVLDEMTLALSAGIAAEIVGMTESPLPGLAGRLSRILDIQSQAARSWFDAVRYVIAAQAILLRIYLADVRPAIRARRRERRPDLISSLLDQGWSSFDILTECVTYGTAGLSTTREFIAVAALHLLRDDGLRRRFLDGGDEARLAILAEILRLEPAVSTLLRRMTAPVQLDVDGRPEHLDAGQLVAIDVRRVNADPASAGTCPFQLRPDRDVRGVPGLMSFGDGHHRCPGATVALHEAASFLDRLLRVPGLRLASEPTMSRHAASTGYVLRGAVLTVAD